VDTPLITRDQVRHAEPDPDLFLAAADRVGVSIGHAVVVGDSIWDLLAHLDEIGVRQQADWTDAPPVV
jgi:beta-phosphoglucomutase-like phosphatase (HAD superfamily)